MPQNQFSQLSDISENEIEVHLGENGILAVFQLNKIVNHQVKRYFIIKNTEQVSRGGHSHKKCFQSLVCISGFILIRCKDGKQERIIKMTDLNKIITIPPSIWVEIEMDKSSILGVFCSHTYTEQDYIRNWQEFLSSRGIK